MLLVDSFTEYFFDAEGSALVHPSQEATPDGVSRRESMISLASPGLTGMLSTLLGVIHIGFGFWFLEHMKVRTFAPPDGCVGTHLSRDNDDYG